MNYAGKRQARSFDLDLIYLTMVVDDDYLGNANT